MEQSGVAQDPIVWSRALGSLVWDVTGRSYVDMCAGFGVAAAGHQHPRVVAAVQKQASVLMHALGDLHPSREKILLLERLQKIAPWPSAKVMLGAHGSDAIEAAIKTARLCSGKPGLLAFAGGYHGLHAGPLAACGYQEAFRAPFADQLNPHVHFLPFPTQERIESVQRDELPTSKASRGPDAARGSGPDGANWFASFEAVIDTPEHRIGAVIVEAIQGRGGVHVAADGVLEAIAQACRQRGIVLIVDEIYTGLGRCGGTLESIAQHCIADIVCLGKALGGGLPVSACIGREEVMAHWAHTPHAKGGGGEAIHTATFFGNPLGAAAASAFLDLYDEEDLEGACQALSAVARADLMNLQTRHPAIQEIRGRGLMLGLALPNPGDGFALTQALLARGFITLCAGKQGDVLQLSPPLNLARSDWDAFVGALDDALDATLDSPLHELLDGPTRMRTTDEAFDPETSS